MAKKQKKSVNPLLITLGGFVVLVGLSGLLTYKQLNNPKTAFAATCSVTVNPGQSINTAINNAATGATICVAPGIYTGNVNIPRSKTGISLISTQRWGAKIVGIKESTERAAAIQIDADNVTINGFDITAPDLKLGIGDEASYTKVIGNYVHDIAITTPCDEWGGAGIEHGVYRGSVNSESIGNFVERVSSGPNHLPEPCAYNQGIYHSQRTGKIMNNIVKDIDAFCIHLWHYAQTNYQIYNNTVINCGKAPRTAGITVGADPNEGVSVTASTIANNIVINSPRGIEQNNASGNFYRNNIIYGSTPGQEIANTCSNSLCENNRYINPQLDSNYRPQTGSPAINAGHKPGAPTTDYEGKNRDTNPDIGAYEFGSSNTTPTNTPNPQATNTPRPSNTPTPRPSSAPQPSSTPLPSARPTNVPLPTTPPSTQTSLGNAQLASPIRLDNINNNKLHGIQIRPAQTTTINMGHVYLGNIQSGTTVGFAIYSNTTSNTPGNLIVQSPSKTAIGGWNQLPLLSTTLLANTTYWLVTNNNANSTSANNLSFTTLPSGFKCFYGTSNYAFNGTFPSSYATSPTVSCSMYFSMYVSAQYAPVPTTQPNPTTPPTSNSVTINFNNAPLGQIASAYPSGVTWQSGAWMIVGPWEKLATRNLSFTQSSSQGNIYFDRSISIVSVDAYNGGSVSSLVTVTCGSQTKSQLVSPKTLTTIATGFSGTCRTGTLRSTNGWDTNFDNLMVK